MIDGINCRVHGDSFQNIMHSDKLQFKNCLNRTEAKSKGLIIIFYKDAMRCYLRGSIHKFKNDGIHNADFPFDLVLFPKKIQILLERPY